MYKLCFNMQNKFSPTNSEVDKELILITIHYLYNNMLWKKYEVWNQLLNIIPDFIDQDKKSKLSGLCTVSK